MPYGLPVVLGDGEAREVDGLGVVLVSRRHGDHAAAPRLRPVVAVVTVGVVRHVLVLVLHGAAEDQLTQHDLHNIYRRYTPRGTIDANSLTCEEIYFVEHAILVKAPVEFFCSKYEASNTGKRYSVN
jgi:hypothetical protein